MIVLQGITLSRGGRDLLQNTSGSVTPGSRVALIGRNGCGKTSLFGAIRGEIGLDSGKVDLMGQAIAWVDQTVPDSADSVHLYAMHAKPELAQAWTVAEDPNVDPELAVEAHHLLAERDAYGYPSQVAALLNGLGFSEEQQQRPVNDFSGGWKMRLALARALLVQAPVLLLDEPTNHLDLDAILWLEDYLKRYEGTVFLISHDREFVDAVATHVLAFIQAQLRQYAGGYTAFERARAQEASQQQQAMRKYDLRVSHLSSFIDRFRAQASKARQVQSRIKALERLGEMVETREPDAPSFRFTDVGDGPDPLLQAEHVFAGYSPGNAIVSDVRLVIKRGERIGVLGRNGAGKTTLLRTLVGELPRLSGEVTIAQGLRIGYFAQNAVDKLRPDESAVMQIGRDYPSKSALDLRSFLASFGIVGERAMDPVGPMSGGERARVALAAIALRRPHLLILDEPTNHLDSATRDALTDGLAMFDGAVLLVSHDRQLLQSCSDRFVLVANGGLTEFDGDLDDYAKWLQSKDRTKSVKPVKASTAPAPVAAPPVPSTVPVSAANKKKLKALEQKLQKLDQKILALGQKQTALEQEMASPTFYTESNASEKSQEHAERANELDRLESEWLELQAQMDGLGSAKIL